MVFFSVVSLGALLFVGVATISRRHDNKGEGLGSVYWCHGVSGGSWSIIPLSPSPVFPASSLPTLGAGPAEKLGVCYDPVHK